VVAAVVEAATTLFAARGPAAVSLREVAQAADVNLGLIHRHIGSKTDLLAAVLRARPGMAAVDALRTPEEITLFLLGAGPVPPAYTLILLRAALDGYSLPDLGVDFPLMARTAATLQPRLGPLDADLRTALATAMLLGWHALGGTLIDLVGHGDLSADAVLKSLEPAVVALLSAKS
jgi:TetR/AcrR family transcriptional regulator, repressor for neighboring sulfatase